MHASQVVLVSSAWGLAGGTLDIMGGEKVVERSGTCQRTLYWEA